MKVTIVNTCSTLNPGDAASVFAQIHLLRALLPNVEIALTSRTPDIDRRLYARLDVEVFPPLLAAPGTFKGHMKKAMLTIKGLLDVKGKARLLSALARSDLVISSGGGYLYSLRRWIPGPTFLEHLLHIRVAALLDRPVLLFPQSFGPFLNGAALALLKNAIMARAVVKVLAREEISLNILLELLPERASAKVGLCPDVCFLLAGVKTWDSGPFEEVSGLDRPIICVTVREWTSPEKTSSGRAQGQKRDYLEVFLKALRRLLDRYGGSILVVPHVHGPGESEDDRAISVEFMKRAAGVIPRERLRLLDREGPRTPEETIRLYSLADLVVGTRLHSCIFAILAGVNFMAVGYLPKTRGTLEMIGLEDFFVDMWKMDADELFRRTATILDHREEVRRRLLDARDRASRTVRQTLESALRPYL